MVGNVTVMWYKFQFNFMSTWNILIIILKDIITFIWWILCHSVRCVTYDMLCGCYSVSVFVTSETYSLLFCIYGEGLLAQQRSAQWRWRMTAGQKSRGEGSHNGIRPKRQAQKRPPHSPPGPFRRFILVRPFSPFHRWHQVWVPCIVVYEPRVNRMEQNLPTDDDFVQDTQRYPRTECSGFSIEQKQNTIRWKRQGKV